MVNRSVRLEMPAPHGALAKTFHLLFTIYHSLKDRLEEERVEEEPRRRAPDGAEVRVFGEEDDVAAPRGLVDDVGGAAQQRLGRRPDEARDVERAARVGREDDRVRPL